MGASRAAICAAAAFAATCAIGPARARGDDPPPASAPASPPASAPAPTPAPPPSAPPAEATAPNARVLPPLEGCRWIPEPPTAAAPPRLTVISLWGPWSSESMTYMPRLSRIAREHAADGVAVRGITREMPGYPTDRIEESVRRLGGRVTFPIGIAPPATHAQIASLAGASGDANTLIIDASGVPIAACTPAELEHVLSRVMARTWTGPHEIDTLRRETRAMDSLVKISMTDPALAASQVDDVIAMHPHRRRDFASRRIVILLRAGRTDEAAVAMRAAMDEWTRLQDAAELTALATVWMDSRTNASGRDLTMAAEAAEAAASISGDLDPNPWLLLMRARAAAGDLAGARAAGERAMAMGDERMRVRVAQLLEKIPQQPGGSDGARQQPESP